MTLHRLPHRPTCQVKNNNIDIVDIYAQLFLSKFAFSSGENGPIDIVTDNTNERPAATEAQHLSAVTNDSIATSSIHLPSINENQQPNGISSTGKKWLLYLM